MLPEFPVSIVFLPYQNIPTILSGLLQQIQIAIEILRDRHATPFGDEKIRVTVVPVIQVQSDPYLRRPK